MSDLPQSFLAALEELDQLRADAIFRLALADRAPIEAVEQLIVPALEAIGRGWDEGRTALSQVYVAGRFCERLVSSVLPAGTAAGGERPRTAIVVLNDYHFLGKRIVSAVLRASGIAILDYGRMDVEALISRVAEDRLEVLLISVLMLPAALQVGALTAALRARDLPVLVAVGGAPFHFDGELWREVGADAMGRAAGDAPGIVRALLGEGR